jgi:chromosomal replication initiator protein
MRAGIQDVIIHDTEIVPALQAALAAKVGQERYDTWFVRNARLIHAADGLTVQVRNEFYLKWLRTKFRQPLEDACQKVLHKSLAIRFEVDATIAPAAPGAAAQSTMVAGAAMVVDAASSIAGTAQANTDQANSARANSDQAFSGHASSAQQSIAPATDAAAVVQTTLFADLDPPVAPVAPMLTINAAPAPTAGQPVELSRTLGRRPFATLGSFIAGTGNRVAAASAAEVAENPGRVSPLVIHGPSGVGKTHLLEGIWTAAKRRNPRLHAVFLTAEQFTSYFLEALHSSGLPNFRHKHRNVDLLLIDDLQFFAGKKVTLVELLHTIDTLQRAGKQIVFAADRAPAILAGLGPELESRLAGGLVCRIEPPDPATRETIVRQYATSLGLSLTDDVAAHLAGAFRGGVRELKGAVHKLHASSRALGRPATMSLVQDALGDCTGATGRTVKLADVQQAVCEVFGLDPQALQAGGRTSSVSHPRMLAMWLSRKHTRAGLAEIGQFFGKRSHTTVISANNKVAEWIKGAKSLRLGGSPLCLEDAIRRVEQRLLA